MQVHVPVAHPELSSAIMLVLPMGERDRCAMIHHWRVPEEPQDEIAAVLAGLEAELASIADVERKTLSPGMVRVEVSPRNPGALPITWTFVGDEIIVEAGRHGGRWEFGRTQSDVGFMTSLVQSVVAGRVRETFGPKRSRVEVTLEDGTTVMETGYVSVVPRPGWRRRGQTVVYESYTG